MSDIKKTRAEKIIFVIERLKLPFFEEFLKGKKEELGKGVSDRLLTHVRQKFCEIAYSAYNDLPNEVLDLFFHLCEHGEFPDMLGEFARADERAYHIMIEYWEVISGAEDRGQYLH